MSAEVHDVLVKARALITDPERWCKGMFAASASGLALSPGVALSRPRLADSWCASGALAVAGDRVCVAITTPEYQALCEVLPEGFSAVPAFNDDPNTTHADVLTLFDRAIEATKP